MKPLPDCSLLTKEDLDIWVCRKWARYTFTIADRRDAALMLEAQEIARWYGPAAIELHGIACRGWNDRGYWIEDTDDGEGLWQRD